MLLFIVYILLEQTTIQMAPVFRHTEAIAQDGKYLLEWTASDGKKVILEQSLQKDFSIRKKIYTGVEAKVFLSGLNNTTYYYRLRYENSEKWSQRFKLTVRHQSLNLAYLLFAIGIIVSLSIAFVIIKGHRNTRDTV